MEDFVSDAHGGGIVASRMTDVGVAVDVDLGLSAQNPEGGGGLSFGVVAFGGSWMQSSIGAVFAGTRQWT